jgi:hypothetical protein
MNEKRFKNRKRIIPDDKSKPVVEVNNKIELPFKVRKMINPDDRAKAGIEVKIEVTIIDGKKRYYRRIPTGVRLQSKNDWSYATKQIKNSVANAQFLNGQIDLKKTSVDRYLGNTNERDSLLKNDKELIILKKYYPANATRKLLDFIQIYIDHRGAVKKKKGSIKDFITLKGRIDRFQKFKKKEYVFEDIDLIFSKDLMDYSLRFTHGNTVNKTFESLTTVLYHFKEREKEYNISVPDVFKQKNFRFGMPIKKEADPLPLNEYEFRTLYISTPEIDNNERLSKMRDRFLIQATCGFRDSDLYLIRKSNLKRKWVLKYRPTKTEGYKVKNDIFLPLNKYAVEILSKYDFDTSSLRISNQKYNDGLKDLFKALGFDTKLDIRDFVNTNDYSKYEKRFKLNFEQNGHQVEKWMLLTSHNGRDTFFTRCIEKGIDMENLMSFTGQTKYEMLRKYVNTTEEHKIVIMSKFDRNYGATKDWRDNRDLIKYKYKPEEESKMYREIFGKDTNI